MLQNKVYPLQLIITGNSLFPGNLLPVLHYKKALNLGRFFASKKVKELFTAHNWTNTWRDGIYTYHHYHSNTHEAMAAISGGAMLLLGGENGKHVLLEKEDVIVIPAGVAHKNMGKSRDVICVGGYPGGNEYDMNYGNPGERPATDMNIRNLKNPVSGPLFGASDPLLDIWNTLTHK